MYEAAHRVNRAVQARMFRGKGFAAAEGQRLKPSLEQPPYSAPFKMGFARLKPPAYIWPSSEQHWLAAMSSRTVALPA